MNRITKILSPIAMAATFSVPVIAGSISAPAAFAGGKATLGCSPPYELATTDEN